MRIGGRCFLEIKPQYSIIANNDRSVANRKFTDRKRPREAFYSLIETMIQENESHPKHHVLVYYGIGGIGKSRLQRNLANTIKLDYDNVPMATIDFANSMYLSPARTLLELAYTFKNWYTNAFPHFFMAYALYFQKRYPNIKFNEEKLLKNDNWNLIASTIGLLAPLTFTSIIPDVVNKVYDLSSKIGLDKEAKSALKDLEELTPSEIEKKLPAFWAYDYKKMKSKLNNELSVIFFDTYEALWGSETNDITKLCVDNWIRELIAQIPGILFVVFSREFIDWAEHKPEWQDALEQHLLDRLSPEDSKEFLKSCGINEEIIKDKMVEVSMGHPYHLDLLVDTYYQIKASEEELRIEAFASSNREILICFLKYLKDDVIATIKLLSLVRRYDIEIFSYLLARIPTGYPSTMFNEFNKYSFVTEIGQEVFQIHEVMRKEIVEYIDKSLYVLGNKIAGNFYADRLEERDYTDNQKKIYIKELLYHKSQCLPESEFSAYLNSKMLAIFRELQFQGESSYLVGLLSEIFTNLASEKLPELYSIYIDMIMLQGEFLNSVKLINDYLERYDFEEVLNNSILLGMYLKRLHHQMIYCNVDILISNCMNVERRISAQSYPFEYNELLFLLGSLYILKGDFEQSKAWLKKSLDWSRKFKLCDMECRTLRKLADISIYEGDYTLAKALCDSGIRIADTSNLQRYRLYLQCSLAEIQRLQGMHSRAIGMYKECQKKFQDIGIHPWVAHTHLALAAVAIGENNVNDALYNLSKADRIYRQYNHKWGGIHVGILRLKLEYTEDVYNESIKLAQQMGHGYEMNLIVHDTENLMIKNLFFL